MPRSVPEFSRPATRQVGKKTLSPPLCQASLPMRRHFAAKNGRIYFTCPVKRLTRRDGRLVYVAHPEQCPQQVLCQPDTTLGPVVYIRSDSDPRLYPPIPRQSDKYKQLMKLRSGCERSNSVKKVTHKLERRPCRSATHYLIRLYLISIIEHAKASYGGRPQSLRQ